tara:strand:- start:1191 stop:1472 length:282 start_codon:yes stop_codon:yes gene_type:complete
MPSENIHGRETTSRIKEYTFEKAVEVARKLQTFHHAALAHDCNNVDEAMANDFLSGFFSCLMTQGVKPEQAIIYFREKRKNKYACPEMIAREL